MTRQQAADAAERVVVRRYETRRAMARLVAEVELRERAESRLDLALRRVAAER